ncbi:hypothetical protein CDD83_7084 [Cordyceps sp. RAO-2017]|nr:hypothetical protein CDD83_7084 [Cordyceps sp. RAO-2017]
MSESVPRNRGQLPLQLGAIAAAYALSLLLVAAALAMLSQKRRQHLAACTDTMTAPTDLDRPETKSGSAPSTSKDTAPPPGTYRAVPYSPYQPAAFCLQIPVFLAEQDTQRARRGPVLEMVKGEDELW